MVRTQKKKNNKKSKKYVGHCIRYIVSLKHKNEKNGQPRKSVVLSKLKGNKTCLGFGVLLISLSFFGRTEVKARVRTKKNQLTNLDCPTRALRATVSFFDHQKRTKKWSRRG